MAKRHAEVAWNKLIRDTPDVIPIRSNSGKSLVPGYIRSYMSANNITLEAALFVGKLRDESVLAAVPTEVQPTADLELWPGKQVVQKGGECDGDRLVCHTVSDGRDGESLGERATMVSMYFSPNS